MINPYQIAEDMLDLEEYHLPEDLKATIERSIELTEKVNGGLVSRQVIAHIVVQWELHQL